MRYWGDAPAARRVRRSVAVALGTALAVSGVGSVHAQSEPAQPSDAALATMAPTATMAAMPSMAPMRSMAPGLAVRDAWTRESPMVDLAGAAFMIVFNTTTEDDALVGASSPAAEVVEIHQTTKAADGTMAMAPVESVPVPAGGSAVLEPGGYHVMLIGLAEPLVEGEAIDITLEFAQSAPQTVSALVRPVGPMGAPASASAAPQES